MSSSLVLSDSKFIAIVDRQKVRDDEMLSNADLSSSVDVFQFRIFVESRFPV